MAQWEDKLGSILNNPQAMSQIMAIAQSLQGDSGEVEAPADEAEAVPVAPAEPAAMPELDPRLMQAGMRALSAYRGPDDARTALLRALRPFLAPERHGKLDKAVRITKLSNVIRSALDGLKGGDEAGV